MEHNARIVHQHVELREIRLDARRQGGNLRRVRDIALNRVEFRVLGFHLIEYRLTPMGQGLSVAIEAFERWTQQWLPALQARMSVHVTQVE